MNKKQRGPLSSQFIIEIDITNTNFRHNGFFLRMKGRRIMGHIKNQGSFLNPEELLKKHEVA
jgi:hypothetical protein